MSGKSSLFFVLLSFLKSKIGFGKLIRFVVCSCKQKKRLAGGTRTKQHARL